MTEEQIKQLVIRRYTRVQNPWGLWRLNLYVHWKRISWRWVVASASYIKRFFDTVASCLLILVLSPLFVLLAVLVKVEDGGPVIFAQTRIGQWGRLFKMFKFRTMCANAEEQLRSIL